MCRVAPALSMRPSAASAGHQKSFLSAQLHLCARGLALVSPGNSLWEEEGCVVYSSGKAGPGQ